ncbi:hypothetical protein LJK88_42960 [Paenibacillus sp. P26]|nr:hypothetical protein LJK88_42960 [Paenibacillus sp. P26]
MAYTTEMLCHKARELALQHSLGVKRARPKYVWNQFEANIQSLRDFVNTLQENSAGCTQPAEEWLLDNAEFIEEQALEVRKLLTGRSLGYLPYLRHNGKLRVQSLCENYLEMVDGNLSEESVVAYINAYQEVSVLTLAETWAIPLIFRISLIGRLAETMALVRERREVCMDVERLLSRLDSSKLTPEALSAELESAGRTVPLSGPWVVHLISHLREWADDAATVREWLVCKYENGMEDLDRIVSYEHRLQAAFQVTAGNLISDLRRNERRDLNDLFERISLLDRTLRGEATGIYAKLDTASRGEILKRVEQLSRRMNVPESLTAGQAVALAKEAQERLGSREEQDEAAAERVSSTPKFGSAAGPAGDGELPRPAFAAYYLFEPAGIRRLVQALRQCSKPRALPENGLQRRAAGTYFATPLVLGVLLFIAASAWISGGRGFTAAGWAAVLLALALPVSEWVVTWLHFGIERVCRPRPLLRYDFSDGVPPEAATMVVIPAIWSTREEVEELADRLEVHYLANRDPHIHYALLGDFTDAAEERSAGGRSACRLRQGTDRSAEPDVLRSRRNDLSLVPAPTAVEPGRRGVHGLGAQTRQIGRIRRVAAGNKETSYDYRTGDASVPPRIRYIITLDADTRLPMESAHRMIGTLHLPYNRPRLNEARTRVVEGYGVLRPRIGISHESAMRSRLASLLSDPGLDPYAFAASDPYQDALEQGIFTGKGIFDVEMFAELALRTDSREYRAQPRFARGRVPAGGAAVGHRAHRRSSDQVHRIPEADAPLGARRLATALLAVHPRMRPQRNIEAGRSVGRHPLANHRQPAPRPRFR